MLFLERLSSCILSETRNVFVISGNIFDEPIVGKGCLSDFIIFLMKDKSEYIVSYDLFSGGNIESGEEKNFFNVFWGEIPKEELDTCCDIGIDTNNFPSDTLEFLRGMEKVFKKKKNISLIINYPEYIFKESSCNCNALQVGINKIARASYMNKNKNFVFLITRFHEHLSSDLLDRETGIEIISVPKPDLNKRKEFLSTIGVEENIEECSKISSGLSLNSIKNIIPKEGTKISLSDIVREKNNILRNEYSSVVDVLDTKFGFDCVGGLNKQKEFLIGVANNMKMGNYSKVPMGILFTGPPGTGKTICAEALAKEAIVNFIGMGSLRSQWVGKTEQNVSMFFRACRELSPVIVWIDEIDNAFKKSDDYDGSSGVERRIVQKFLEQSSDTSMRGRILFIGASNRIDLMDKNVLRSGRFSVKIPFLSPEVEELEKIFPAILKKYPEINCSVKNWRPIAEKAYGMSGADVEAILVDHAWNKCIGNTLTRKDILCAIDDFPINNNQEIELMTNVAISTACPRGMFL